MGEGDPADSLGPALVQGWNGAPLPACHPSKEAAVIYWGWEGGVGYHEPNIVLSTLCAFSSFNEQRILLGRHCNFFHFANEDLGLRG